MIMHNSQTARPSRRPNPRQQLLVRPQRNSSGLGGSAGNLFAARRVQKTIDRLRLPTRPGYTTAVIAPCVERARVSLSGGRGRRYCTATPARAPVCITTLPLLRLGWAQKQKCAPSFFCADVKITGRRVCAVAAA